MSKGFRGKGTSLSLFYLTKGKGEWGDSLQGPWSMAWYTSNTSQVGKIEACHCYGEIVFVGSASSTIVWHLVLEYILHNVR